MIRLTTHVLLSVLIGSSITFILLSKYSLSSTQFTPRDKQLLPLEWQKYDYVKLVDHFRNSSSSDEDNDGEFDNVPMIEAPLDIWNPILPHTTPINDITVRSCSIPPSMEYYFGDCYPPSTIEEDAKYGPWVRVGLNLNIQDGSYWQYVYYRRSRRLDISYIDDVKILTESESTKDLDASWFRVNQNIRSGLKPSAEAAYIWYHIHKPSNDPRPPSAITEIDVLFGHGPAWPDFHRFEGANVQDESDGKQRMTLTARKGYKHPKQPESLRFKEDGSFRILQIADLHFSVGKGTCRDTDKSPCEGDEETIKLMAETLDDVKPDFVVFTGDQLNGQGTSFDAVSVLAKVHHEVVKRKIPFTAIFGNHDSELTESEQMRLVQALPFSFADPGPSDIHGVGNHVLKAYSPDSSKTHLLTMYFLDTHALLQPPRYNPFKNMAGQYDYIRQNQINWFVKESDKIKLINRPFIPQKGEVYDDTHEKQKRIPQTAQKANAIVFGHIPLREYYDNAADLDENMHPIQGWGRRGEEDGDGASSINGGFFNAANGLLRDNETGANQIRVIAHGHCHLTDECKLIQGTWICFGGGSSFSGYGRVGHDRRFRVYDVSEWGEIIETFKRTEKGMSKREKIAKMSLSVEPALRTLAWLLPGRFDDSELVAECIFSSLNVITQEQDIQNATHSKNPHSRYTTKADWGALHKISSRLLTLIGSLQLLGEIVMHRRERTSESAGKQRWNYISAVEALKFTLRLIILLKTRFRPLIHPSTPSRDQDSTLDPEYKPASKVRNVDEFKREYGTVDNYLRSVALGSDAFTPPSALVRPLNSIPQVVSELLLAAEPLVYALALRRQYIRTQTSRQLRKYDQRNAVSPYAFDVNKSSIEMNEHMRREQSFIRYLLRGPIWSDFTKPRVESLVHRFENWPLIGLAAGIVGDYIPLVDNYHFYTSA
ncbi:Metallo-dependent phosphatase [Wallemia mellicola]|uniref:Metallo-dependent phosphatase n=1 Tax=Wallemia mellicola TaxID=1708541 RepID=A0A4T0NKG0_9BASI|nr:hypothetical protein E3Q24_02458 [Wallemia mellicola]TIB78088.1 Metallo-dependent phosphatase [Wallemia mellicola]TIB92311.1 Metallo-dependent phosphatase [Wallemia mellicola]TIB97583.1 Metallo-dependent phosphatase [Wallemia mellicola]TIC01627.1 Metallo-dependent phosphatase [Wallemia mellicola]